MKKILMILAASTMVISPMVTAQAEAATHKTVKKTTTNKHGKHVVTKTTTVKNNAVRKVAKTRHVVSQKRWTKGQRFDRRHAVNYRVISNPRAYRLSNAPRGYRWVRSGNDAILVGITSGIIGAVIGNAILR